MNELLSKNILRWRWIIIFISLVLVFLAASGNRFLSFTGDYRVFFSDQNPQLLAFQDLEKTYTKDDNVLFVLEPKNGTVFTNKTLAVVQELTKDSWQIPFSSRVDSITNFQYTYSLNDELIVEDLINKPLTLSITDINRIKTIALSEPLLVNQLLSPASHVTGINITIQLPGKSPDTEAPLVANYVRDLANKIRSENPDINVYTTGTVLLSNAFFESSANDMATLIPITLLIVIVGIGIFLRSWTSTFSTLCIIILSIMSAMGLAGWFGLKLTAISAAAPTIILIMAVANAVHILVTLFHNMNLGSTKSESIAESLRVNLQPVFLTCLTTVVGFLSLNFSDAPPFHDLGNIVAMGICVSFLLSIFFLPALMSVLPVRKSAVNTNDQKIMSRFADFILRTHKSLLWISLLVVVILVSFLPNNEMTENLVEYFDTSMPIRTDADFVSNNLGGIYNINFSLNTKQPGGIADPDFLTKADAFANWLRTQPEVIHVRSMTDTFKRLNKNMHNDESAYYKLSDNRQLTAQYLFLYESSLPYGLDLTNQINIDKSAMRLTATTGTLRSNEMISLEKRAQDWLSQNAPLLKTAGSSTTVMFSHIGETNIKSMMVGTTIALVIISLILMIALRSIKIGLISLIPNIAPLAISFGLWGIFVSEINVGVSVVAAMTLGIVVDDTVHFLSKYLRARREKGLDAKEAVRYAFHTVGKALWITSFVIISGFFVLTFSTFKMNSDMGLLTAITVLIALAADFILLPALLIALDKTQASKATDLEPSLSTETS